MLGLRNFEMYKIMVIFDSFMFFTIKLMMLFLSVLDWSGLESLG